MSEVLSAAAAAMGIPEALVERAAAARAAETGLSTDEILTSWAGGEAVAAPPSAVDEQDAVEPAPEPAPEQPSAPIAEPSPVTAARETAPASTARARVPDEVTPAEAARLPEVITVPTAGIRERTNFRIPRWLTALMLIIPAFALFALGGSATGVCGERTELATDVVTGEIVNCDGSDFTGAAVGGGGTDYLAEGEAIYNGSAVSGVNCAGCHGANGGGGAGPPLNAVVTLFGSCADHIEWVQIGTPGYQAAGRPTYGDTNKPVGGDGIMPPHQSLTDEQLAAVSAFERVRFGGADPDETLAACGLTEEGETPADGETPEDGETPADGEGPADGDTATALGSTS